MPGSDRSRTRPRHDDESPIRSDLDDRGKSVRRRRDHDERRHQSSRPDRPEYRNTRHSSRERYRQRDTSPDERDHRTKPKSHLNSSPSPERSLRRRHTPSHSPRRRRRSHSRSRSPRKRKSQGPLPSQNESFGQQQRITNGEAPLPEKQKPNFKPTGLLAKEANTVAGTSTVLKYHEPAEARKPSPKAQWRLYVFKKKDLLDTILLYQRSAWLTGRDAKVTDLRIDHPSISKQHAVIQFRYMTTVSELGDRSGKVKPYLIDLESANGTTLNGKKIDASRYVELVDGDVISFGDSEREYVMMLPPT